MIPLHGAFRAEIERMLGAEAAAFFDALEESPVLALRLNPARANAEAVAAEFFEERVPWEPNGRYLLPGARPGASIAHAAGAFYLQEASAMVSVNALEPRPGERILDLCAAPGGKSTQIAAAMAGEGLLVANEPEPARARILASNLERMGARNAVVVNAYPDALAARWTAYFDALLCDAPCSGEGMFRREIEARAQWNPGAPEGCARRQAEILDSAAELIRPGGRLVYSTCTFNPHENEETVRAFLLRHPDFVPEDFHLPGVGDSREGMIRVWPQRARGDGHFAARLRKRGGAAESGAEPADRIARGERCALEPRGRSGAEVRAGFEKRGHALRANVEHRRDGRALSSSESAARSLVARLEDEICALPDALKRRFLMLGDALYALPEACPPLDGLKVVQPGVRLLRAGRSHIEPEHALAMALEPAQALRAHELSDEEALRYLRGEVLNCPENLRGWVLMRWRGLPLGWAKAVPPQFKNHLPKGLRAASRR